MTLVSDQITGNDPYERTMARALATRDRLAAEIARIQTIGVTEFPPDWLPWLVIHYGLEEIAPYVGDLLRTLVEGRPWQRIVGTPTATEAYVLEWLGIDGIDVPDGYGGAGAIEEEPVHDLKWCVYQIALAGPIGLPTTRRLIAADHLSRNAGTMLGRIYGGYDIRPMRLDGGRLDGCLLDDWSGVFVPPHEPKLSFGRERGETVEVGASVAGWFDFERCTAARFEEGFVLDRSRLDDEQMEPAVIRIEASSITDAPTLAKALMPWPMSRYPKVRWGNLEPEVCGGPEEAAE